MVSLISASKAYTSGSVLFFRFHFVLYSHHLVFDRDATILMFTLPHAGQYTSPHVAIAFEFNVRTKMLIYFFYVTFSSLCIFRDKLYMMKINSLFVFAGIIPCMDMLRS